MKRIKKFYIFYVYNGNKIINGEIGMNLTPFFLLLMQQGCPEPGYDGEDCSSPCSDNCQEDLCDIVNKTCLGCVAGYIGSQCIEGTHSICHLVYLRNLVMISQQQVLMIFIVFNDLNHYQK